MIKYRIEFADRLDNNWRIEIDSPIHTGSVIELTPAENPLYIEYSGNNDDDIFRQHFIPSSATFSVVSTGVDINELMYISDASYKCRVYSNSELYWQGYIVADGIQEVDSGIPYDLTIRAIDGIEVLDNIPLAWGNYGYVTVNGQNSELRAPINAFRVSLYGAGNLDNRLPLKWNSSLKNDQYPADDMLAGRTEIAPYGELLNRDNTCLWWIGNLAKSAQSWIYQSKGYWYINDYFKSFSGKFGGYEIPSSSSQNVTALENNDNTISEILDSDTIDESWFWFGKKPYGSVDVIYKDTKFEGNNVLPNGGFDDWSSGGVMFWGFEKTGGAVRSYDSLLQREGYSVDLDNRTFGTVENPFTFADSVPLDSAVLFKKMLFRFTFIPIEGFQLGGNGEINWSNKPLKVSVKYSIGDKDYYLNEFGFWQTEARGTNLGTYYMGTVFKSSISNISFYETTYERAPNVGDVLVFSYPIFETGRFTDYSFTVTSLEAGNLEMALNKLRSVAPPGRIGAITMQTPTLGRFSSSVDNRYGSPQGRTYKSGAVEDFKHIYPTVDGMKPLDIATVSFSGKGGSNEIIMPQGLGKLKVSFILPKGIRYALDDVYITVDDFSDIYTVSNNSKNSKANYDMEISSGYSGNMESSYGNGYFNRNLSLNWNGGGSLTEHYAKSIMKIRNKPCRVFSGTIDKLLDFGMFRLMDKVYAPLSMRMNIKDRETEVVGAEFNPSVESWTVKHKSNEGK